ncbi:MAG: DHH family phosphoesterase [Candidatus Synoicihabitans palmerolidicus]|nr:DHH family phosphoesterase [Candidatus Synoicihabitans palmerolidicus]
MKKRPLVFVTGHQRPDTDAAVAAMVLEKLKKRLDRGRDYQPLLLGPANRPTVWLYKQARTPLPPVRPDIRWTVAERMRTEFVSLPPDARLGDAMAILQARRISMVPVVDENGRLLGVVSPRMRQNEYFFNFNVEDYLGHLLALEDVVETFALRALKTTGTGPATVVPGSFRVASGGPLQVDRGDVVMAGASSKVVRTTERAGAQAVIVADAALEDARQAAAGAKAMPVYFYPGSMLALLSSLSLAIPLRVLVATDVEELGAEQRLDQVLPLLQAASHALPMVDTDGCLVGVMSQSDAIAPPLRPLILVDHFECTQTVKGIEHASIEEIVDHHRVGAIETVMPARVDCRPLGSSSTIVALQYAEAGQVPTKQEALLLLGALVADTLLLTSPTATETDRRIARELAARANVDMVEFGREVLRQNDELMESAPDALVEKDVKSFKRGEVVFAVAQLETVDLGQLTTTRVVGELREALGGLRIRLGWQLVALIITDVLKGDSLLLVDDPESARAAWLLQGATADKGRRHAGMVARKKQLLPFLFERLDTYQG